MASGYFHSATVQALLEGGADPSLEDRQGRDPVKLIDNLREATPLTAATMGSRTALEEVSAMLTGIRSCLPPPSPPPPPLSHTSCTRTAGFCKLVSA